MENISILIVTKNRSVLLEKCLQSLATQKQKPREIILVDNGSTDKTQEIIKTFRYRLAITPFYTNVAGYPKVYNYGLKRCRGDWIVFFDDDCIAGKDWFSKLVKSIRVHPRAIIQGKTDSMPKGNIYAEIMGDHYHNWIQSNLIICGRLRTFDNKNLCIPRRIIEQYGMFNEALIYGSEDIELGIRYANHGIPIFYEPSIIAYHHERDTLAGFINQHIRIARSEALLDRRLQKRDRIGVSNGQKINLYLQSFIRREAIYARRGEILNFLKTPLLYFLLAAIRTWTYYMTVWSIQK
jgi:GT2 family glycosyltransferase